MLTVLTADVIDEVEPVDWLTTLPLAVNEVNVVNPVHVGSSRALADYRQRRALSSHGTEPLQYLMESNHARTTSAGLVG